VLQASDPDTPATALTYRVDAVDGGQFERAAVPGTAVQVFTQAELDAAQVAWVAPAGSTSALYTLRLSDGFSEVRVGAPTLELQSSAVAVTATELTLGALSSGNAAAVPSAGGTAATTAASPTSAESTRRADGARAADVVVAMSRAVAARGGAALTAPAERGEQALSLSAESAGESTRLVTDMALNLNLSLSQDLWTSRSGVSLVAQLDRLRQEVGEAQQAGMVSLASTALVSTGVSVGYVIWLVRGGVLMTSLMSVVPAWAGMDPLPVLAEMRRAEGGGTRVDGAEDDDNGGEDDPIEKLFSKARRLLVRPAAGPATAMATAPDLPETLA
jgi:hypothetical protein